MGGWRTASTGSLLLMLFTVILAGGSLTEPTNTPPVLAPSVLQGGNGGLEDPIDVDVRFASAPRIGLPSPVVIGFTSQWDDLSDVHAHMETSEDLLLIPEDAAPSTLVAGHERTWRLSVVPTKEGFHRVAVRVVGQSVIYGSLGGLAVLTLELPVEGAGGVHIGHPPVLSPQGRADTVAGPSFDAPLGAGPRPSPLPAVEAGVPLPSARMDLPPAQPQSHASFNVTGQWNYWLEDDTTTAPQRWATVEVWDEDPAGLDDLLWMGMTNDTGGFTSPGLPRTDPDGPGNQDVYVRFVACNAAVCIQATNGTTYSWRTETATVATEDALDFGARASTANEFAQRPFQYINNGWDYAANLGGLRSILGQVRVLIPDSCTFYTLADDTIHLCADGIDDKSPDDVNHEYGHYVQDKMYRDSFWPSPGGVHTACGDFQHRGLSWTEGFADFFGPRANREIVDPTDHFYTRPWDGSIFRLDLEDASICAASVRGDDNELRVATSLWDLTDEADDGALDLGIEHLDSVLLESINGCDQSTYQDFYDSGVCNWVERGNPRLDFLVTAFQNTIDYNFAPVAEVTAPDVFRWAGANIVATANATDADTNVTRMEFGIDTSATCTNVDMLLRTDVTPPYSVTIDVSSLGEATNLWVCARASDEMEAGGWAPSSASFGIDRTPPTTMATLLGTLGTSVWYVAPVTVELAATDTASGVAAVTYRLDGGEVQGYTAPFVVEGDGTHTLAFFAVDVAGNSEPIQPLLVPIDTGPPIIQIVQPPTMGFVGQSDVVLQWSVTDAGSGVASCAVGLDGGQRILVEEETAFTFANVADGPHTVTVTCSDVLDRAAEVEVGFTVDTNPLSLTGPFGPTFVLGLVGLGILVVALLIRRKR